MCISFYPSLLWLWRHQALLALNQHLKCFYCLMFQQDTNERVGEKWKRVNPTLLRSFKMSLHLGWVFPLHDYPVHSCKPPDAGSILLILWESNWFNHTESEVHVCLTVFGGFGKRFLLNLYNEYIILCYFNWMDHRFTSFHFPFKCKCSKGSI